jgi:Transcription factor S-II (TFIIS)
MSQLQEYRVRGYICLAETHGLTPNSCVTYQDQSKRKETRMTLFYVCTNTACGHTFQDPAVVNAGQTGMSMDTSY